MGNPRRTNGTKRTKLREFVKRQGLPCALCGKPIDYSLHYLDPMGYVLDEIVPVSKGGSPYDLSNVQPAHRLCNARKGNKTQAELEGSQSAKDAPLPRAREW